MIKTHCTCRSAKNNKEIFQLKWRTSYEKQQRERKRIKHKGMRERKNIGEIERESERVEE